VTQTFEDDVCRVVSILWEVFWHHLPIFVVWVGGLVLAWRRRHRHPRISFVTFIVLVGFLLDSLGGTFLGAVLASVSRNWGWSRDSLEMLIIGMNIAEGFFVAALWALLLAAIFGERQTQADQTKSPVEQGTAAVPPSDERFFER
jgi:hypothetical protein